HEARFRRAAQRIIEIVPRGSSVLDLGSHYLHLASIIRLLGYNVVALDVPEFQHLSFVRARAEKFGIRTVTMQAAAAGDFLPGCDGQFDVALFCEILEHITFNPCEFWKRLHKSLKIGGKLYLSTPNSLSAMNVLSAVKRIILLQGIGMDITSIFNTV